MTVLPYNLFLVKFINKINIFNCVISFLHSTIPLQFACLLYWVYLMCKLFLLYYVEVVKDVLLPKEKDQGNVSNAQS